jgi:hypothetical protein
VSDDQYAQRKRVLNRDSVVAFFATTAAYGKTRIMEYFKQLNAVSTTEESSAIQAFLFLQLFFITFLSFF